MHLLFCVYAILLIILVHCQLMHPVSGGCWLSQATCTRTNNTDYVGTWQDGTSADLRSNAEGWFPAAEGSVDTSEVNCHHRAEQLWRWCKNDRTVTTNAEYRPTGQTFSFPKAKFAPLGTTW